MYCTLWKPMPTSTGCTSYALSGGAATCVSMVTTSLQPTVRWSPTRWRAWLSNRRAPMRTSSWIELSMASSGRSTTSSKEGPVSGEGMRRQAASAPATARSYASSAPPRTEGLSESITSSRCCLSMGQSLGMRFTLCRTTSTRRCSANSLVEGWWSELDPNSRLALHTARADTSLRAVSRLKTAPSSSITVASNSCVAAVLRMERSVGSPPDLPWAWLRARVSCVVV
mmetsp:Transcript_44172/g.84424  ORF Transcript_44172/g.84424 Transcript_44172/m.84424 type:complete len:227 (+) Transcript_44172:2666-3346(+)